MRQIRQGDVFLAPVRRSKREGKAVLDHGRVILAYGEATGHAHEVVAAETVETDLPPAQLFEQPDGKRFLFVDRPCNLTHQEHGLVALTPGVYEVIRQREYSPAEIRNVAD